MLSSFSFLILGAIVADDQTFTLSLVSIFLSSGLLKAWNRRSTDTRHLCSFCTFNLLFI